MLLKPNAGKLIVGYHLGSLCSQISYCNMEKANVETLSAIAGEENFNIPTVLCKRSQVNQWSYGKEALRSAGEGQGVLVENLLELAVDGEKVQVDGSSYDPVALLTLFLKKSLTLFSIVAPVDKISAFVLTVEKLDHRLLEVLSQAVAGLSLKTDRIAFQSHAESFYCYMLYQPLELWNPQSVLFDYEKDRIYVCRLECYKRTEPVSVFIKIQDFPFRDSQGMPGETAPEEMDQEFLMIARKVCEGNLISSVFLIGEAYEEEWMKESLRYLCRGRRVFQGSNLYSKGACYGMLERLSPGETGKKFVFLGNDKLRANIGMKVMRQGVESYLALLDAGSNWYEADYVTECYLQEENSLELMITPLEGRNGKIVKMTLEGLNHFPVRIRLHLFLPEETMLRIEAEDLGFGEFVQTTNQIWMEEVKIY